MSKRFYSKKSEKLAAEAHEAYRAGKEETDLHEIRLLEEKLRERRYRASLRLHDEVYFLFQLFCFRIALEDSQQTGILLKQWQHFLRHCSNRELTNLNGFQIVFLSLVVPTLSLETATQAIE
jgi:hypothetical protein